ncbi:MAG: ABC transporter ATP-binding protein [Planctomycetes bacterium]|nr:ABC transporter ATP-binding protein [Planctomycetota bacterium]
MSDYAIEVKNLHKRFDTFTAVDNLSFQIKKGSVVGFVGANGAGKTTTMRIISTLDLPSEGKVWVDGLDAINQAGEVRKRIGWMPDYFGKYKNLTVLEYLDFFARTYGFRGHEREERVNSIMAFIEMESFRHHMMDKLSKGLTQRMGLGRALIHDPSVLILDEPAAGLDPKARIDLKRLIRILSEEGKTLFISSHILSELEEMCDSLLFLDKGALIHHGDSHQLKRSSETHIHMDVKMSSDNEKLYAWCQEYPGVSLISEHSAGGILELDFQDPEDRTRILKAMLDADLPIVDYHEVSKRLEDVFVNMLENQEAE